MLLVSAPPCVLIDVLFLSQLCVCVCGVILGENLMRTRLHLTVFKREHKKKEMNQRERRSRECAGIKI